MPLKQNQATRCDRACCDNPVRAGGSGQPSSSVCSAFEQRLWLEASACLVSWQLPLALKALGLGADHCEYLLVGVDG
jgi:hypothetical protein